MISTFHHVGIGVNDAARAYRFYRDELGFRQKLADRTAYADELSSIIGASVKMRMIMASNERGGGAVKLVEHLSTRPLQPQEEVQWGDIGLLEIGLGAYRLEELYLDLKSRGVEFLTPVRSMDLSEGGRELYAYLRDPEGSLIQLVESGGGKRPAVGGVRHVAIGVSDMEKARELYGDFLGFDGVVHEFKGRLPELDSITGGKEMELVYLEQGAVPGAPMILSHRALIKLVYTPGYNGNPIYEGRRWGDIGLTEIAFEKDDLGKAVNLLISGGVELLQAPARFPAGAGVRGSFAYLKDPGGVIIEMIEPERMMRVSSWLQRLRKAGS
jgi:catechol 2,3-dioxygenase-like lactoylglutathione lyase family enzyme